MRALTRKYLVFLPVFGLLFGATACDSSDDSATDSELFVGNWNVTEVFDGGTAVALTNFSAITIAFTNSKTATITATPVGGGANQVFSGAYTVNEADEVVVLTLTVQGFSIPVTAAYSFSDNDTASLTIDSSIATVLGPQLFGTQFTGDLRISVERI